MSTLEAEAWTLPELKYTGRNRASAFEQSTHTEGTRGPVAGLLILRNSSLPPREVIGAAHRAGMAAKPQVVSRRGEVVEALRGGEVDLILASGEGLPDMGLPELLERARSAKPPVPAIVVGESTNEDDTLRLLREGAADYVAASELDHLSVAMARALQTRHSGEEQARTKTELERASGILRDNQKLIGVGRLAATIAHEINNPLESVTNLLYLLGEEDGLSEAARGYLAMAQRELDRAAQISRQTLKFARETAGPQRARIDELMEEVLALYSRRITEKNLRIERRYDCREEALVFPGEMRQVLSNLVTNAIEASSMNGRLCLRVRGSRSWADGGVRGIRVSVADTGTGIPPEVQRRLGEPFFTTKGQRGTGLGLWVTRSIIERYGGEIQLRSSTSDEHHGTVFSIFLPTNLGPRAVVDRPRDSGESNSGTRPKILSLDGGSSRSRAAGDLLKRRANGE